MGNHVSACFSADEGAERPAPQRDHREAMDQAHQQFLEQRRVWRQRQLQHLVDKTALEDKCVDWVAALPPSNFDASPPQSPHRSTHRSTHRPSLVEEMGGSEEDPAAPNTGTKHFSAFNSSSCDSATETTLNRSNSGSDVSTENLSTLKRSISEPMLCKRNSNGLPLTDAEEWTVGSLSQVHCLHQLLLSARDKPAGNAEGTVVVREVPGFRGMPSAPKSKGYVLLSSLRLF